MEYFVEYYSNEEEGEQAEELSRSDFVNLVKDHKARGFEPMLEHDVFTMFENGRDGERLTVRDEYGLFYG